ncbi:MAG: hypothetical protein ACHQKY_17745 [Terriglobia bacterium]
MKKSDCHRGDLGEEAAVGSPLNLNDPPDVIKRGQTPAFMIAFG